MTKYGWMNPMFDNIDWDVHHTQLKKFSVIQRVTLIKCIHGWFATKKRWRREGATGDAYCPLCGGEEDILHLFRCQNK